MIKIFSIAVDNITFDKSLHEYVTNIYPDERIPVGHKKIVYGTFYINPEDYYHLKQVSPQKMITCLAIYTEIETTSTADADAFVSENFGETNDTTDDDAPPLW